MRNVMAHIFFPLTTSRGRICTASMAVIVLLALAGCATMPPPNDAMNLAQARLQAARDADASDYAPVDLGFAQDKFQQAQAAMAERKYADAANLAEESRADAELARAKAQLIDDGAQQLAAPSTPAAAPAASEMPAPATSTLSAPPLGGGFQTVPAPPSGGAGQTPAKPVPGGQP
jgi:hypothetical protein